MIRHSLLKHAVGALNFNAALEKCENAKIYQASSSEMFGTAVDEDKFQRESTSYPVSPYGCSKLYATVLTNFRRAYKMHISNGILFNHESPEEGQIL